MFNESFWLELMTTYHGVLSAYIPGDQQEGLSDDTFFSTPVSTHGSVVNYISPRKVLPNGCSGRSLSIDELEQR